MIKEILNLVLSASQLPESGSEKKAIVKAQLKELDIPGYDEAAASVAIDICVRIYKSDETKKFILKTRICCKKKFFQ